MFMFMMCFQCVNGFIYSILYTPVTVYMYSNTTKGQLWIVSEESFEMMGCPDGFALDVSCSWSVSTCCDSGLSCSIYSCCSYCGEGASAPYDIAVSLLNGALGNFFVWLPLSKTMLHQRHRSVWDKCHKCNINCHIAIHACVLSQPTAHPPGTSTDIQPSLHHNRLLGRSHKDSEPTHHPSLNTHTKSYSLKLQ